jgi:hypothetical protein
MSETGTTDNEARAERLLTPDWKAGASWAALLGVALTLGLVLGGLNALGQMLLEDYMAVAPEIAAVRDMGVLAALFGFSAAVVRTLENPLGGFTEDKWWKTQRLAVGSFPAGTGPSLVYMVRVCAALTVAYVLGREHLGRAPIVLILVMNACVAVYAALYPPLRLLRRLARRPARGARGARGTQGRRRPFATNRRRN